MVSPALIGMESLVTPEGTEKVWVFVEEVERVTVLGEVVITRAQRVSADWMVGGRVNYVSLREGGLGR